MRRGCIALAWVVGFWCLVAGVVAGLLTHPAVTFVLGLSIILFFFVLLEQQDDPPKALTPTRETPTPESK